MKKMEMIFLGIALFGMDLFAESYKTGEALDYFPKAAPKVASKSGDSSSCYITKISKAAGYTDGTYELQLTSADWIGASVFPVTFTYLVKKNDILDFVQTKSVYLGSEPIKVVVKAVSENSIELEKQGDSYGDINPSEDSL
ncbi:MAG: hypothetical protein K6C97_08520 [Treponema sp.]|nr:hypothetical protein [Treponema sp.]